MNLLWRDSGKPVRFFGVDGRAAVGLLIVLLHISIVTLSISILLMVIFSTLERFDYTLPNAGRKFRVMISGRKKKARHPLLLRRYRSS
jgi:hypothetical protein